MRDCIALFDPKTMWMLKGQINRGSTWMKIT